MKKQAIVVHSGGMDSSICLALAIRKFGRENVLSLSFSYGQRHSVELSISEKICHDWQVDHTVLDINCLQQITRSSLLDREIDITHREDGIPNSIVFGRNGLMARLAGIHVHDLGGDQIYMGVIGVDADNSGYLDCSREYMDLMQQILRLDFNSQSFEIKTPIVFMTKVETMELARSLGVLDYLLETTISCYEGVKAVGCGKCPACKLRNQAIIDYYKKYPTEKTPSYFSKLG